METDANLSTKDKKGIILIVDDNVSNIKVIVKHLKDHNFETIIARNGKTGIERARFSQPDLILLDVLMPEMDGFETCRRLKKDKSTRDIPVLFMTVLNEISDKLKAFKAGAVDYVTKPIQEEEILARVNTHLKLRNFQKSLELKNETLQYQSMLLDQIKDSIISTDLKGQITYANESALRLLLRDKEELIGKTVHILGENSHRGAMQNEIIDNTIKQGHWQGRVVNYDKNGSEHIIETRTWLIQDHNGKKTGIVGISTDITEQARMQEDLKIAKDAAEAASKAKTTFLANMSHELKSPLNAIIGFSQLMADDQQLSLEYRNNLKAIFNSGKHLLVLINDLLEISTIESDRVTIETKICNINKLIYEVKSMFRLKAEEKDLQLFLNLSRDLPEFILVDENKLRQVLINLFSNAIKFTDQGEIRCRLSLTSDHENKKQNDKQCIIRFEIEDTGVGIGQDELDDLFEPFIQLSAGKNSNQGTGLGLSISRKYVQLMGGDMGVKSKLNSGSLFWFTICAQRADTKNTQINQSERLTITIETDQANHILQKNKDIQSESEHKISHNLTSEAMSILPADLLIHLKQAASNFDLQSINTIIKQIRNIDQTIADTIEAFAYNFNYTEILNLIENKG